MFLTVDMSTKVMVRCLLAPLATSASLSAELLCGLYLLRGVELAVHLAHGLVVLEAGEDDVRTGVSSFWGQERTP